MTQLQSGRCQLPAGDIAGRVLIVDLQNREWRFETLGTDVPARFLGGRGVSAYLLSHYCDFDSREAAPVAFAPGLLTGVVPFGLTCLTSCTAPGFMATTLLQGLWGVELKMAGCDHLLLMGESLSPLVLKICNERIVFEEATGLWEKGFEEAGELIAGLEGDRDIKTLVTVGSAEPPPPLTAKSPVGNEIFRDKRLKAISVRGTKGLKIFDPPAFKRTIKNALPLLAGQHVREDRFLSREGDLPLFPTASREGDELSSPLPPEELSIIQDCLGLELELDIETMLSLVYCVTGAQYTREELGRAAQRIKLAEAGGEWE